MPLTPSEQVCVAHVPGLGTITAELEGKAEKRAKRKRTPDKRVKDCPRQKKTKAGKKSALRGTLGLARICHQGCLVGEGEAHKCTG